MTDQNTQVAKNAEPTAPPAKGKEAALVATDNGAFSQLLDTAKFEHLWRVSQMFAKTKMVPEHFQNAPHDCFVALQMAFRLNVDPMMLMQNTYVVHGKPGMEAKMAIALVNARGPFRDGIDFEYSGEGDTRSCTAYGHLKSSGARREQTVDVPMAKGEGWWANKKWQNLTDLMLSYRSAMFLCRLYAPECLLGMSTVDELEDIGRVRVESSSRPANIMSRLETVEESFDRPALTGEIEPAPTPQERSEPVVPKDAAEEPDGPPKKRRRRNKRNTDDVAPAAEEHVATGEPPNSRPGRQATADAEQEKAEPQLTEAETLVMQFADKWPVGLDEAQSKLEIYSASRYRTELKSLGEEQLQEMAAAINDETIRPFGQKAGV